MAAAGSAPPPTGGGGGADSAVPDVTAPKVVHRVKSKMGYTEMHTTAPGFGENVRVPIRDGILILKNWIYFLGLVNMKSRF